MKEHRVCFLTRFWLGLIAWLRESMSARNSSSWRASSHKVAEYFNINLRTTSRYDTVPCDVHDIMACSCDRHRRRRSSMCLWIYYELWINYASLCEAKIKWQVRAKGKIWYFVELGTLIPMVYVSTSCDLPILRYSQFKSRNGAAAAAWSRLWHTPKSPRDVLDMSWTRSRSLLVSILQKFFEFFLRKKGQFSRFPS